MAVGVVSWAQTCVAVVGSGIESNADMAIMMALAFMVLLLWC